MDLADSSESIQTHRSLFVHGKVQQPLQQRRQRGDLRVGLYCTNTYYCQWLAAALLLLAGLGEAIYLGLVCGCP